MADRTKTVLLEEILAVDEGTLNEEMELSGMGQWDSLARISFVSLMEDNYGRVVGNEEIRKCRTVGDLLAMME